MLELLFPIHGPAATLALWFVLGALAGGAAYRWGMWLAPLPSGREPQAEHPSHWWHQIPLAGYVLSAGQSAFRGERIGLSGFLTELGTGLLFLAYVFVVTDYRTPDITKVYPPSQWWHARMIYHMVLMTLLIAATVTDLRDYLVPDAVTIPGMLIGLAGAAISGHFQIVHLWIDWNMEVPGLIDAYVPAWLAEHPHLHGLAWSAAGLAAGGGITWVLRFVSSTLLRQQAMGLGDVTLMAMVGSYLGWQPVVFVFLLAPFCGMAVGLAVRLATGRSFIPYGPYLAAAAVVVLFTWKWLWTPTRLIFGHVPSLVLLGGVALGALIALLVLLRLYRAIPIERVR